MPHPHRNSGFSVVELLVAMGISLVLLGGVVTLFVNSRTSYESNDHLARIQENGRFALDAITRDLRSAGYMGCAKQSPFTNSLNNKNTLPWNFSQPIAGFQSTGSAWTPVIDASVQSPAAINSDVLVVRAPDPDAQPAVLFSDMADGTSDLKVTLPASFTAGDVLMISDCNATSVFEVSSYDSASGTIKHAQGGGTATSPGNSSGDIGYIFLAGASILPVRTTIYYVRQGTDPSHGNSLWRRVGIRAPEELVEGVDSLQVLYGVDTNGDRAVDNYVTADVAAANWDTVLSARIGLLVRSVEQYGNNPDSAHAVLDAAILSAGDNRERIVFTSTATIRNKAL